LLVGADQDGVGPGYVWLFSGPTAFQLFSLSGGDPGERFGAALAGGGDLNGDGVPDFAVGASAGLWQGSSCGTLRSYSGADGTRLWSVHGSAGGEAFGSALCFLPDLDGDGRSELAVSALFENGAGGATGIVRAISSSSQRPVRVWRGRSGGDRFGSALIGVSDRDGDNLGDLVVGAPKDDGLAVDGGAALTCSTRDATAQGYCTGKLNSQGCVPQFVAAGYASVSGAAQLELRVQAVVNNKVGILFFGRTRAAIPFQGGSLCIAPPIQRSSALHSGGNLGAGDCSGVLSFSVDPMWILAHNWQAGERFDVQAWYRDPQHPDATASGLSDALEFSLFL
jgi:hypothetical protein